MENKSEKTAHDFAKEVCRGDKSAEVFCHLWYVYCHAIDDLIDTMEDGRPTMNPEQILAMFANAALLYNCPFFVANRNHLFPIVLSVTNAYADSVMWEKSPLWRRRAMADTLRMCGDEMFFMIAMLIGGWDHMRSVSGKIRERDWVLQHDEYNHPN